MEMLLNWCSSSRVVLFDQILTGGIIYRFGANPTLLNIYYRSLTNLVKKLSTIKKQYYSTWNKMKFTKDILLSVSAPFAISTRWTRSIFFEAITLNEGQAFDVSLIVFEISLTKLFGQNMNSYHDTCKNLWYWSRTALLYICLHLQHIHLCLCVK